jgi:hypothetical protein
MFLHQWRNVIMDTNIELSRCRVLFFVVTVLGIALASTAWGEDVILFRGPIATLKSGPSGITWEPRVSYKRLVLIIKAPGSKIIRKEYAPGSKPVFSGKLVAGQYTYELSVVPLVAPEVRQALKTARATGDMSVVDELRAKGALPTGPHVQSGYFRVYGGKVIPPQGTEAPYEAEKKN